jgi:hypothetical protein
MKSDHMQEICKEIERSEKSLAASEKLYQSGLMEDAISRSYYAVLHAARAAILSKNVSAKTHEAVKRLFGMHLVKTGDIADRFGVILRQEQDDRYLADYDVTFLPEKDRVEQRIKDAALFLAEIKKYLVGMGISLQ